MSSNILELFTTPTQRPDLDWASVIKRQYCTYLQKTCVKCRKSQPEVVIGTCAVKHGTLNVIICPHRFLERKQVFMDCIHLLTLHEPGNELHLLSEVSVPGRSVDYVLVSARERKVVDFTGIELQAIDTTGTLWPQRQRFLLSVGENVADEVDSTRPYGMNWKMSAKTILVQLHHKIETFSQISRHLVLVLQDCLLNYMRQEFSFSHIKEAKLGDPMHFHAYALEADGEENRIRMTSRLSTDAAGIATCLGLQASTKIELDVIIAALRAKISEETLLTI